MHIRMRCFSAATEDGDTVELGQKALAHLATETLVADDEDAVLAISMPNSKAWQA